ncbi:MAG: sugar phosphate isomerase/epimerase [Acidobacteria bacterium]|nr:sugar phosphate isomerase/epimerase [Acidobacteriota bacterium]MBV9437364.1 sugar phosphate isomerase/epimerase [Acidobacteriota bacterium]
MLRAMSTHVRVRERLQTAHLEAMLRGGAQAIELFCQKEHFDYTDRGRVRELSSWFREHPGVLHSVHSPIYSEPDYGRHMAPPVNLVDNDKRKRVSGMDEAKRAIEFAEHASFRFLVQHLGVGKEKWDPRKMEYAITALEHLRVFAKPLGVTVLVENIANEVTTPERLQEIVTTAHFDDVGFCFDVGHAHFGQGVRQSFEVMQDRIRSTHLHDNHGERDEHLWIGEGTIDWAEAMALLRTAPHRPAMLLEITGESNKEIAAGAAESFEKLEKALEAAEKQLAER